MRGEGETPFYTKRGKKPSTLKLKSLLKMIRPLSYKGGPFTNIKYNHTYKIAHVHRV